MNVRAVLTLILLCSGFCASDTSDARPLTASKDWAGTWILNLRASRFSASAPKSEIRTIVLSGSKMFVRSNFIDPRGASKHFHYSVTLDGRFHPLVGNPDGDSIAARLITARKVSITVRRNGMSSATATTEVSETRLVMQRHRLELSGSPSEDILLYDRSR